MSKLAYKEIYILHLVPEVSDDINKVYVYYIDESNKSSQCNIIKKLTISTINVHFICKYISDLESEMNMIVYKNFCNMNIIKMKDSQLFTFNHEFDYYKVTSSNSWNLSKCFREVETLYARYFSTHRTFQDPWDKLYWNNTETPFRFTENTLNPYKLPYYLSTNFEIPNVGPIELNYNYVEDDDEESIVYYTNIKKAFKQCDDYLNLQSSITIMSYDIETSNIRGKENKPEDVSQQIINIGIGFFKLNNPKPFKRLSIISSKIRDFGDDAFKFVESNVDPHKWITDYEVVPNEIKLTYVTESGARESVTIKTYRVYGDSTNDTNISKENYIDYVIVRVQKAILRYYIKLVEKYKPYFITGFNNWTFDDYWLYTKFKNLGLLEDFERALGMKPKWTLLNLKLDGQQVNNKYATWIGGFTMFQDTMYTSIKEDPKRFSDRSRKNLDTMLKVYGIKSPYGSGILQKTGYSIFSMWEDWPKAINLYEIAKYCCQDAWITGVFCVQRNHIVDLIEMSGITYTTIEDSLIRANSVRVANTIEYYAHKEKFALYDTPNRISRNADLSPLCGNRVYDSRVLIGGAVRNKRNGREKFIIALDFSSMYPSQKEGSNVDTSSRVDNYVIEHYEEFGLKLLWSRYFEDTYAPRMHYLFEDENGDQFNIEEFFTEYKLNPNKIKKLVEAYNTMKDERAQRVILDKYEREIRPLNIPINQVLNVKLPLTVIQSLYFCQSPKDTKTLLPTIHYSLKEKMLSDFREKRNDVKKAMAKTCDKTVKIQLSAKEKAIKVVMNSEYGQTGSNLFAHYDSDIGAAVTYASRHSIAELTSCLYTKHFYVDNDIADNENLAKLIEKGIASVSKTRYEPNWELCFEGTQRTKEEQNFIQTNWNGTNDLIYIETKPNQFEVVKEYRLGVKVFSELDYNLPPRRLTTFDTYYELVKDPHKEINIITIKPSDLVYQDTDSNYYTNDSIVGIYNELNPTIVNDIMNLLLCHNRFFGVLIKSIIHRPPIGVGFEGAFIVARYLNKKKKYYGKKWLEEGMKDYVEVVKDNLDSWDIDNKINPIEVIKREDGKYIVKYRYPFPQQVNIDALLDSGEGCKHWIASCTIPFSDGTFMRIPKDIDGDFIDLLMSYGIKCTGVDIARRDQFKFININNLEMIKNDLQYLQGKIAGPIETQKFKLEDVVSKLLDDFYQIFMKQDRVPEYMIDKYKLELFCRAKTYNKSKQTEIKEIMRKYELMYSDISDYTKHINIDGKENDYDNGSLGYYADCLNIRLNVFDYDFHNVLDALKRFEVTNINMLRGDPNIPKEGDRVMYLMLDPENNLRNTNNIYQPRGDGNKDLGYALDMLKYGIRNDIDIITQLYYTYYFEQLATVLCNYIIIEHNPTLNDYLNETYQNEHPELNQKEIETIMAKVIDNNKKNLVKEYMKRYNLVSKKTTNKVRKLDKETNIEKANNIKSIGEIVVKIVELQKKMNKSSFISISTDDYNRAIAEDIRTISTLSSRIEELVKNDFREIKIWAKNNINSYTAQDMDLYKRLLVKYLRKSRLNQTKIDITTFYINKSNSIRKITSRSTTVTSGEKIYKISIKFGDIPEVLNETINEFSKCILNYNKSNVDSVMEILNYYSSNGNYN